MVAYLVIIASANAAVLVTTIVIASTAIVIQGRPRRRCRLNIVMNNSASMSLIPVTLHMY